VGNVTTFDAGRGCPFQCSFCTIINVQGRKSRRRSPDDVEHIIRHNLKFGIDRYFITDDNFARNKDWEAIFDRIIELRERDGIDVRFMIQVDTLCHKIPNFIDKAKRAGVTRIFIGLENINPDNLLAAKKRQNKITEYRKMLLAWKAAGIWTYAGYILGFPNDTPESVRHDLEILKRELPLDILEFFFLTPLPGSAGRHPAPHQPSRTPVESADRAGLAVLSSGRVELPGAARTARPARVANLPHLSSRRRRCRRSRLLRSGDDPGERRRSAEPRAVHAEQGGARRRRPRPQDPRADAQRRLSRSATATGLALKGSGRAPSARRASPGYAPSGSRR
jgi:radical SAM superfamily enzyme YgiQ (UPF0313 family)